MNYALFPTVYDNGVAETGVTAVVNDRDTSITVPWDAGRTGSKDIVWRITNDLGREVTVTVPVTLTVNDGSTTAAYAKGAAVIVGG